MTNPEPDYLDAQAVADHCQITRKSVWERLSRGEMPEPDLIWMKHPLWLPETIKDWRDNLHGSKTKTKKRKRRTGPTLKRSEKVRQPDAARARARPPRIKRPTSDGASVPLVSVVSEQIAKQIASLLREAGHHCTTADVMELAGSEGEADHERDVLRQRVQAKLRGLKARKP
jgi:predicted DNA-binding transcriptional regulator AlpA